MPRFNRFARTITARAVLFMILLAAAGSARAQEVIWSQGNDLKSTWGPSTKSQSASYNVNSELADDFDLVGTVNRVDVSGYNSYQSSLIPAFFGVYVRFYASNADGTPGALRQEYYLPSGDPNLWANSALPSNFRVTLSPAFQATGKHFVSVQPVMDQVWNQKWYWWSANTGAARGQTFFFRDLAAGQTTWGHDTSVGAANGDLCFTLYGTRVLTAPVVSTLSAVTLAQAGRFKISGENFGAVQGTGVVKIGGAVAPVSRWSDTSITAYVPDAAAPGANDVRVVTAGGTSNPVLLDVTARQRDGQVRWRFQADDFYIQGRPGVGPDGTIYAGGINGHLYALTPDGGVKWIFRVQGVIEQSVSVGADGTVYFAASSTVWALNPDGTVKWKVTDPAFRNIDAGPNVGPDGNIYAVSDETGFGGYGAFAVSPAGQVLWTRPGYTHPYGSAGSIREIVFGPPGQFYFNMNHVGGDGGLQAFQLGGTLRWFRTVGGLQPAVAPDGTVYVVSASLANSFAELSAFDPQGNLIRKFFGDGTRALTAPDIGADGTVYVSQNYSNLLAVNPDGTERWRFAGVGTFGGPVANPANTFVAVGGYEIGLPGFVHGVGQTGQLLWTVNLPAENDGYVRPMSRPRFSADGTTAYVGMDVNSYAADPYTYLYAIDTLQPPAPAPTPPPAPAAALSTLTLSPASVTGGNASQGTVTLSAPAPAGGALVSLSSSNTAAATVPASVNVPAGATSAGFTVTTRAVAATTAVTVSATYGGVTRTASLGVTPAPPPPATDTVAIQRAEYTGSKKELRVEATSTKASATLKVYVTSTGALVGTLANNGGRYSGTFQWPANPQNITVRSSLGGTSARAVTAK